MRSISVSDLKKRIRARTEQEGSKFIGDDELLDYIDSAACELYDILVTQFKDYFIDFANFNSVTSQNIYQLPANFYKLRGLDYITEGKTKKAELIPFENRDLYVNQEEVSYINYKLKYYIMGNCLVLLPTPRTVLPLTLWYVPTMPRLTNDSQLVPGFSGWEEVIINECCARIATKAEEDPAPFYRAKEKCIERIEVAARQRDVGSPDTVVDVTGVTRTFFY